MNSYNIYSNPSNMPAKAQPSREDLIYEHVEAHLHPYISGQITSENEPPNRPALMHLLEGSFGKSPDVPQIALKAYLEKSALGLYVNLKLDSYASPLTSRSAEFNILVNALKDALPKDFPKLKFAERDVRQLAAAALEKVTWERMAGIAQTTHGYIRIKKEL